ncbi:MAG: hypothetical protein ABR913_09720 [Sedimentisphaerales bacterium]|jgi:hypothetical protein
MSFVQYYLRVLSIAFSGAWAVANAVSFVLSILFGVIAWKYPPKESIVKDLMWVIPLAIFVVILIISVAIVAPYQIYQNQQQKIDELRGALKTAPKQTFAIPDALTAPTLQNMTIRLSDLVREDFIIRNRTFVNCHIYGPAIISLTQCTLINNVFTEAENIFIETTDKTVTGAIGLDNCIIKDCTFHKISFIGLHEQIEFLKAGIADKRKK